MGIQFAMQPLGRGVDTVMGLQPSLVCFCIKPSRHLTDHRTSLHVPALRLSNNAGVN